MIHRLIDRRKKKRKTGMEHTMVDRTKKRKNGHDAKTGG